MPCSWLWNFKSLSAVLLSEAELLRARATCYLEWAVVARDAADLNATEYLTALAMQCSEDAAALDAAEGKSSAK